MRTKWIVIIGVCVVVLVAALVAWAPWSIPYIPPVAPNAEDEAEARRQREEMRLAKELHTLVGLSKDQVKAKQGEPMKTEERGDRPMFGPAPERGNPLRAGQPYDEWTWNVGPHIFYVWFAGSNETETDRSKWKAVDVCVSRAGTVY